MPIPESWFQLRLQAITFVDIIITNWRKLFYNFPYYQILYDPATKAKKSTFLTIMVRATVILRKYHTYLIN